MDLALVHLWESWPDVRISTWRDVFRNHILSIFQLWSSGESIGCSSMWEVWAPTSSRKSFVAWLKLILSAAVMSWCFRWGRSHLWRIAADVLGSMPSLLKYPGILSCTYAASQPSARDSTPKVWPRPGPIDPRLPRLAFPQQSGTKNRCNKGL